MKLSQSKKDKARDLRLRREYGITLEEYNKILSVQEHRCGICKVLASRFKTNLAVDHCHKTGLVRGLLCMTCNRALARFKDNAVLLANASDYITNPPAVDMIGTRLSAPGRVGTKKRAKLLLKLKGGNGFKSK